MASESLSKSEETRERIIAAAYRLFQQKGYAGTSIRDIAEAAGLTTGGIYGRFASKEDIWSAVFEAKHPYHQMIPLLLAAQGDDPETFIRDAAHRLVEELSRHEDLFNLLFIEAVEFKGRNIAPLAVELAEPIAQLGQKLTSHPERLREVNPVTLARAFGSLFFMYHVTDLFMPPQIKALVDPHVALDEFIDIFLHGVLADPPADGQAGAEVP
jgi:AcrR family transcriptional regulator